MPLSNDGATSIFAGSRSIGVATESPGRKKSPRSFDSVKISLLYLEIGFGQERGTWTNSWLQVADRSSEYCSHNAFFDCSRGMRSNRYLIN